TPTLIDQCVDRVPSERPAGLLAELVLDLQAALPGQGHDLQRVELYVGEARPALDAGHPQVLAQIDVGRQPSGGHGQLEWGTARDDGHAAAPRGGDLTVNGVIEHGWQDRGQAHGEGLTPETAARVQLVVRWC